MNLVAYLDRRRSSSLKEAAQTIAKGKRMSVGDHDEVGALLDDASHASSLLSHVAVQRSPATYRAGGRFSYFVDLAAAETGDVEARERLSRHGREVGDEMERRDILARVAFEHAAPELGLSRETRDLTRVDGAGGNFMPPLWLLDEFGVLPRAGRVVADRLRAVPLPVGTDSVSVPRITTGTATAIQTADNAAVQETDLVDAAVTAPVRTIAGQQDVAIQLAEQGANFDRVVYGDLMADYDARLEAQVLTGSGASGQLSGLLTSPGTTASYTDATPTVAEFTSKLGSLAASVAAARQRVPSMVVMHPRRAFWMMSQADSQTRPFNPTDLAAPERDPNTGPVGSLLAMSLALDPSVPTNLGAGTNEDRVIVVNASDHILLEGPPRLTYSIDVLSGTLTVRFGLHRYVALLTQRVPSATGVLDGTGLVAPTFA